MGGPPTTSIATEQRSPRNSPLSERAADSPISTPRAPDGPSHRVSSSSRLLRRSGSDRSRSFEPKVAREEPEDARSTHHGTRDVPAAADAHQRDLAGARATDGESRHGSHRCLAAGL